MKKLLIRLRESVDNHLHIEGDGIGIYGICDVVHCLDIFDDDEEQKLKNWLSENLPAFTCSGSSGLGCNIFSWPYGEKEPRLKWLDQKIEEL